MIVAQRSAFFSALLRHRALEASTGRVSLSATEITRPTFLTLLHWVYTGALPAHARLQRELDLHSRASVDSGRLAPCQPRLAAQRRA